MTAHVKLAGQYSTVDQIYARVGGSWKDVEEGYLKVAGAWEQFFDSAGPSPTGSYDLLATEILTSATSSVTFSSLGDYATDYQHLQIRAVVNSDRSGQALDSLGMTFNGDTGSNYAFHQIDGTGSSVRSDAGTSTTNIYAANLPGGTQTSTIFAGAVIDILDPFETTKNTTVRALGGLAGSTSRVQLCSGLYNSTNAVTQFTFNSRNGANLLTGSRFSLYGIRG
jgi:hypothetical protein